MKPRHMVIINTFFLGLMLFASAVVIQFMTGRSPASVISLVRQDDKPVRVDTDRCSDAQPIAKLEQAQSRGLQRLSVFQQACHSLATNTAMVFVGMPASASTVEKQAKETATLLKEYQTYGVRPLVIVEPTDYVTNENLDFAAYSQGAYQPFLESYFTALKAQGVESAMLGIVNPFPEANLPYWKNNEPEYFAPSVNRYISTLRKYYPQATTSIMLNSATYETTDFDWANGDYSSWMPYIKQLTPKSIDYVGMQGFPWASPKGGNGLIINAAEYLNPEILSESADYLGIKQMWYNTGSFGTKYALDEEKTIHLQPSQRKAIMATVSEQVGILQQKGYAVSVNIFAEDKSKTPEETDWSYWQGNDPFSSPAAPVVTDFIRDMHARKADVWLFDK